MSNFRQLSFSPKAKYPTLESLQPLAEESGAGLSRLDPSQRRDLLEDRSARTEVEKADGAWPAVERAWGGRLTLADLRQIFSDQVAPAQLEASTRGGYYPAARPRSSPELLGPYPLCIPKIAAVAQTCRKCAGL